MNPTPYPDLNEVLDAFVEQVQLTLGDKLVGLYLQGSFAVGDFDKHSDVDWIAVLEDELTDAQVAALQTMHAGLYQMTSPWAQHLEGSYFPKATLKDFSLCGTDLWYLDNGADEMQRSDHCNTLVVRWTVYEHGVPLLGPPPQTLLGPVPAEDLKRDVFNDFYQWGQQILENQERYNNRFYQGFITLSYCRMLQTLDEGIIASKRAGDAWAKANLDVKYHGLIDRAWETRIDVFTSVRTPADTEDFALTMEFLRYTMDMSREFMGKE